LITGGGSAGFEPQVGIGTTAPQTYQSQPQPPKFDKELLFQNLQGYHDGKVFNEQQQQQDKQLQEQQILDGKDPGAETLKQTVKETNEEMKQVEQSQGAEMRQAFPSRPPGEGEEDSSATGDRLAAKAYEKANDLGQDAAKTAVGFPRQVSC
jgi:hypothetical protein